MSVKRPQRKSFSGEIAMGAVAGRESVSPHVDVAGWGWGPAIVLAGSFGLLAIAYGMRLARNYESGASIAFWIGMVLIYAPVAFRQAMVGVPRRERIALLVWLGLSLYVVKVLRSPSSFVLHDEFPHWRTAYDILVTGHLFKVNSLQEVSALYPGLEVATAALAGVSGLSVTWAGTIVVAAGRLLASLAAYLLYERISESQRVAGIGGVLTIAYPNYLMWSSQFGYESLALPLATVILLLGIGIAARPEASRGLRLAALLILGAVVTAHHVTSYFLAGSLVATFLVTRFQSQILRLLDVFARPLSRVAGRFLPEGDSRPSVDTATDAGAWRGLATLAVLGSLAWLVLVGTEIIRYLGPHLASAARGLSGFLTRQGGSKELFSTVDPFVVPRWEQSVAIVSVLLIALVLPFGLLQTWRRLRLNGMAVLFALVTLSYPVTLALRMTGGGTEISNRSWDFLFIPLGLVLGMAVAELWLRQPRGHGRVGVFTVFATVLFLGSVVVGAPPWTRLPGPYALSADTRAMQEESRLLASWARENLGPDNRVIADYTNKLLLGSFGEQYIVDGLSWVFLSPKLAQDQELADLARRGVEYVVVDFRMTTALPRSGHYYEPGEPKPGGYYHTPLDELYVTKFDDEPCLDRMFDSGNIRVYAVGPACGTVETP